MKYSKINFPWLKTSLLLLAVFHFSLAGSQSLGKYVPSDASFVFTMNLRGLDKKVNLAQLQQYDFYSELVKSYSMQGKDEEEQAYLKEFFYAPSNLGYDAFEPFYFFVKNEGQLTFLTLVIKLGDRAKYEQSLRSLKKEGFDAHLQQKENYLLWQDETNTYAWNDEVVVNVWGFQLPGLSAGASGFDLEPEPDEDVFEEPEPVEEPMDWDTLQLDVPVEVEEGAWDNWAHDNWAQLEIQAGAAAWADKILNRRFLEPITASPEYMSAKPGSHDTHFWLDYGFFMESLLKQGGMANMGGMQQYMAMFQAFMEIFYADTYFSGGLDFNNGKMSLQSEVFFNEDMKKFYQGMLDVKFNKKFLKYLKGGNELFGYMYANYNIKKTIEEGKSLMYKLADATPGFGELASDVMRILGIFIDEDAIGNLLKGDMLLAVSGMQSSPVSVKTFEMDEEFNMVEKDTIVMKTAPIVTALLSYGNEKDIMKFVNLGLHAKVLTQEGRYYRFSQPNAGVEAYLALHDGVLIFTNNKETVVSRLDNGFEPSKRFGKKHKKLLCDHASVMFWDIPNTIKAVSSIFPSGNPETGASLESMAKELESVQITAGKKVENSVKGRLDFNFANKNLNALEQFFRFVNNIYLGFSGAGKT